MPNYRSGFERTIHTQLITANVKFEYEAVQLPFTLQRTYCPDFYLANGIFIEAKGLLDKETRTKMLAVKQQHPDVDIRFVFMDAKRKCPGLKSTHGEWATKNNYLWADRKIPDEWLLPKE